MRFADSCVASEILPSPAEDLKDQCDQLEGKLLVPAGNSYLLAIMCDTREFCRSSRDSTMGINFDALGDVEHFDHISGDLLDLLKSREHTDVTFVVNGVRFPAHKVILAARCTYFRILLYGEMKEAFLKPEEEIPFLDTTPEAFEQLLEYIYSGRVCLGDLKEEVSS